jgi:hypothetical protein
MQNPGTGSFSASFKDDGVSYPPGDCQAEAASAAVYRPDVPFTAQTQDVKRSLSYHCND